MKYTEDQIVNQITLDLSSDSSMPAKQNAGAAYANWFYANHNHGVEDQKICISKIASVLGLDFGTAVRIQAPILAAYSAAYTIGIANEVIFSQHAQVSQQISNHLVDKAVQHAREQQAAKPAHEVFVIQAGRAQAEEKKEEAEKNAADVAWYARRAAHAAAVDQVEREQWGASGSWGLVEETRVATRLAEESYQQAQDNLKQCYAAWGGYTNITQNPAFAAQAQKIKPVQGIVDKQYILLGHAQEQESNAVRSYQERERLKDNAKKAMLSFATAEKQWVVTNKPAPQKEFEFFKLSLHMCPKSDYTTITKLNLSNSGMGVIECEYLAHTLTSLHKLKYLDVSGNHNITKTGYEYLQKGLEAVPVKRGHFEVVRQDLKIVFEVVKGFSIDALKATMKSMLSIAHNNGISTKETLTTDETITHCKKGVVNVGLNIGWGVTKCFKTPAKYLTPKDVTFQDVMIDAATTILPKNPYVIGTLKFICVTEKTVFSVVDEDFANCLQGLVGVGGLLDE